MAVRHQRTPHDTEPDVAPRNTGEDAQTYSMESLVDWQQYHQRHEQSYHVPLSKPDVVRQHVSNQNADDTQENCQQRANNVGGKLAHANLCQF
jgi:hypothetical protein